MLCSYNSRKLRISPHTKDSKCDDLQCGVWLSTAATCAIIEVHVVITIHVQQNLKEKKKDLNHTKLCA
jgi:hypothetical protein